MNLVTQTRTAEPKHRVSTSTLLTALAVSSPLWAVVSLTQVATREGFDLTRHPLSMLATGDLAWLQITNFLVAGTLAIIGAVGLRRVLPSRWIPRLVTVYGAGYILSGVFTLDPGDGFPAGTPRGAPSTISWHAGVHLLAGTIAFIALTAVLIILGRHFSRRGERGWAVGCYLGAAAVIIADVASMAQVSNPSLVLAVGILSAMLWLSLVAARLSRSDY
jgi:uncharacterized protein DUF998